MATEDDDERPSEQERLEESIAYHQDRSEASFRAEMRERVAHLEAVQEQLADGQSELNDKQDEILAEVRAMDDSNLDAAVFDEKHLPRIEKNSKVRIILYFIGATASAALGSGIFVHFF